MTAPQLGPGALIAGKYQVASLLGQGGSSNTFYCMAAGNREVIAKVFDPVMAQRADVMGAIQQIYAQSGALPPDAVVRVMDAGYDPATGAPFSATERVPYPSLTQVLAQKRALSHEDTAAILSALGRTLDGAHASGLFHHALKPNNVFVNLGKPPQVCVSDFGAGWPRLAVPTQEGYTIAAPWLAPEQAQQGAPAGAAADVFAAALLAFFMLTGRPYWRSSQGALDYANWQRELMSPRDPASTRASQLGVPLSPAFDAILGNALAIDPASRFRSVGEFAGAFESVLSKGGNEATMAFPVVAGGGDYPPPPAPIGGMPGGPGQGYGPQPGPQAYAAPAQAAQGAPAYGGMAAGPQQGPGPVAPKPTSTKAAPIIIAVVAVVLLGVGITAVVLMGKKKPLEDEGPVAVGSAAATSSGAAAAPEDSGSAAPEASGEPAPSAEASATPDKDAEVEVALRCEPACDEIKVDDKALEDVSKPTMLKPGKHKVVASKAGFATQNDTIRVEPGKKFEKQYTLAAATKTGGSGPKQPCGKFLKRCN